jgi:proline utilization trans-activator
VLLLVGAVDPSLLRALGNSWHDIVYGLLEEMIARGNLIATFVISELRQMSEAIKLLPTASTASTITSRATASHVKPRYPSGATVPQQSNSSMDASSQTIISPDFLGEWNSDDGLSSEQLMALADSLDFEQLDWLDSDFLHGLDPGLPH